MNDLSAFSKHLNIDFSAAQILWFLTGPLVTIILWYVLDRCLRKIHEKSSILERVLEKSSINPGARQMLKGRIKTLSGLSLQAIRIPLGVYFLYVLLGYFNFDPRPFLAGIGVVGLGLTLAAQNILRDFINGLFIVFEDQFNVGESVSIGSYSGTVESFSMRVTRLRRFDGSLVIIPNGSISVIQNSTKDFSKANVEVGVAYDSNIRDVMEILKECAEKASECLPGVVVDDPEVYGVVAFRDNDVMLRVLTKTYPGEQWKFERQLRTIILERFSEEGIDIPFPQVVVHPSGDTADE
ncbi:MAG: mechanosensitive ion channel family protein [Synergistaceae bacterium]|jgi:small conductance mechanosensitive channel|nr:mechanosensitive ion channel family protein [Synergistaceae bacterium]